MLKKISATLVAFVLALGLSLVIAPASAVADEQASPDQHLALGYSDAARAERAGSRSGRRLRADS
ncbi:hypothetical protein [Homoserinibacter gongjuensis]|uniref:Uncharacterized protein n=1 Tax=Homoserinibacter gongjuensis TaxID=1162968 RepID=A0ABQ6JR34_9MICO|nr:hypothetical protein [Homoserinibacter gongjuensis]GMA90747.1 hypothetical protein GCM10025869_12760 [Homoserinibacter gongjuensis]